MLVGRDREQQVLVRLLDDARAGRSGVQDWLGFYYKSPQVKSGHPEHDLAVQYQQLQQAFHEMAPQLSARAVPARARS